jgi:hypothetical protein
MAWLTNREACRSGMREAVQAAAIQMVDTYVEENSRKRADIVRSPRGKSGPRRKTCTRMIAREPSGGACDLRSVLSSIEIYM